MGELLFFACTKKCNQKKVHPGRWSLRDFPRSVGFRPLWASYFSLLAQRNVTKRKCTPADGRFATFLVTRCLVSPLDTARPAPGLTEPAFLAGSDSRASLLGIFKGGVKSKSRAEQSRARASAERGRPVHMRGHVHGVLGSYLFIRSLIRDLTTSGSASVEVSPRFE